jgi:DNA polymerase-3 subunit gamma/tau
VGENKLPPQEGRQRSTLNLSNIGKVQKTAEEKPVVRVPDKPIEQDVLKKAWEDFIELRKAITPDLSMMRRGYVVEGNIVKLDLQGSVEEMLFRSLTTPLITFLRDRTGNSSLMVEGRIVEQTNGEKKLYTTKDKFEHLAAKNPVLKEMKEKLGLDPDLA